MPGLLHEDVTTVMGAGLRAYCAGAVARRRATRVARRSRDERRPRRAAPVSNPFSPHGGLRLLTGNLGRAVIKTSAISGSMSSRRPRSCSTIRRRSSPRSSGQLAKDFVAVLRFQGPRANGMPELHQLTPSLASLQRKGFQVAIVTDGRMSGASGSVPAAIHVTPEAVNGGPLARVRDGDIIRLDCHSGVLEAKVPESVWRSARRAGSIMPPTRYGTGRELFAAFRRSAGDAEAGAISML
jgi:phosphogluconate dehydratase